MSEFLTNKKHNECIVNWLYKLAKADGKYTAEEQQLVNGIETSLNVKISNDTVITEELSAEEILFTLRELYRLGISDGEFSTEERAVVDEFCLKFCVKPQLVEITKNWFEDLKKAEENYKNAITKALSL